MTVGDELTALVFAPCTPSTTCAPSVWSTS
jgi:hypothetical protein